jgi:hypothetical protein
VGSEHRWASGQVGSERGGSASASQVERMGIMRVLLDGHDMVGTGKVCLRVDGATQACSALACVLQPETWRGWHHTRASVWLV